MCVCVCVCVCVNITLFALVPDIHWFDPGGGQPIQYV